MYKIFKVKMCSWIFFLLHIIIQPRFIPLYIYRSIKERDKIQQNSLLTFAHICTTNNLWTLWTISAIVEVMMYYALINTCFQERIVIVVKLLLFGEGEQKLIWFVACSLLPLSFLLLALFFTCISLIFHHTLECRIHCTRLVKSNIITHPRTSRQDNSHVQNSICSLL